MMNPNISILSYLQASPTVETFNIHNYYWATVQLPEVDRGFVCQKKVQREKDVGAYSSAVFLEGTSESCSCLLTKE